MVGFDKASGECVFHDCAAETPKGRVSVCYDREGLESRKEHKPANTAMDMAEAMGIALLTEEEYFALQKLGVSIPRHRAGSRRRRKIRRLGGALYGDPRYDRVFIGHNGAQLTDSARGFRGSLRV